MANPLFDPLKPSQGMVGFSPTKVASNRLTFAAPGPPVAALRYETNNDARVREWLKMDQNMLDDDIDELLRSYHRIGRIRAQLGIK